MDNLSDLPPEVQHELEALVAVARRAWGEDLLAVVLYGSAAEGRLRPSSDVNLLLLLRRFTREQADQVREALRVARAAAAVSAMFLLQEELEPAMTAFAVKFEDILSRHRVLYGEDPFACCQVTPEAARQRLIQVLLNLRLRLRERYLLLSLREEQLAGLVAEYAGPLRACAGSLLRLEGRPESTPRAALAAFVAGLGEPRLEAALPLISEAREKGRLPPGAAGDLVYDLMDLVGRMQQRLQQAGEAGQ